MRYKAQTFDDSKLFEPYMEELADDPGKWVVPSHPAEKKALEFLWKFHKKTINYRSAGNNEAINKISLDLHVLLSP